jgi:peptidyl-prolyl cis-trans isomerase D
VRERWVAERSALEARKDGEAKLAAWKAAPATATLPAALVVSREQTQQLPNEVVDAALRADLSALPAKPVLVGIDLGTQGYAIVKVNKLVAREAPAEAVVKQGREQYTQAWTAAENLAYYNGLKQRFKADITVSKPAPGKTAI